MSKFNKAGVAPVNATTNPNTFTAEGSPSFKFDHKMELYQTVVTTLFGEGKFYEGKDQRADRITRLVRKCVEKGEADFVANLAVYAREQMNLRSIPIFLTVTLVSELRKAKNTSFAKTRRLVGRVIQRADEIREMFAAAEAIFGDSGDNKVFKRVAPRALLKGIADAFNGFDAYQFKKYSGGSGSVKFTDVMRVVHPTPKTEKQSEIFKKIMEDSLPAADTWETKISTQGSTQENWQQVADSETTGYMAKLRNLRNFVEHNVDLTKTLAHLTNEKAVANSKQLPFRFYTAYRELGGQGLQYVHSFYQRSMSNPSVVADPKVLTALEDAFDLSVRNLPDLGDDVLIVVDQSGSMQSPISDKSTVTCAEIAGVLGAAVWYNQVVNLGKKAMVTGFASRGKVYNWSTRTSSLAAAREMMNTELGGGTLIETAWHAAQQANLKPTTIIVLSDMQLTDSHGYYSYNSIMVPERFGLADGNTLKVSVNLQGYDNTPLAVNNGWFQLSGWSERVFDLMEAMTKPGDAVKIISNIDF